MKMIFDSVVVGFFEIAIGFLVAIVCVRLLMITMVTGDSRPYWMALRSDFLYFGWFLVLGTASMGYFLTYSGAAERMLFEEGVVKSAFGVVHVAVLAFSMVCYLAFLGAAFDLVDGCFKHPRQNQKT